MKRIGLCAVAVLASAVSPGLAAWDVETSVGAIPMVMNYQSKEPEANTDWELITYPLSISVTFNLNRINRVVTDLRYADFDIPAGKGGLGVSVKGWQLTTALQHRFRMTRNIRPWIGGGLVSSVLDVSDRHRTDRDGFLIERLSDRTDSTMSAIALAGLEWEITRYWVFATEARYEVPFSDGLHGYGVGAGLRYQF